ncbi:hypothetical protein HMSSN036_22780 [Paenibacillus macerans]|uniref:hypothetical protein n=1 Tax=Paenibacillus TaxID=44249 RepID=UPI00097A7DFE|nr:hypothetical protein [Paenibacillus macerans]MEC0329093.1 hypothetical protein [Paenibacillus macerans]MED4954270.1 hypothetical protein [Paenibacillus macerans]OMG51540.1 hypothetical protein BK140_02525 [Paenibacillus macerans]GJM70062.1 hypothetical protein HMSSN036_22780 [Paenibacillus macerans]
MNEELLKAIGELLDQKLAPLQKKIEVVDAKVERIEEKVDKLAAESPEDVMSMLELLNRKLDEVQRDVEFTYHKTSLNELEINRLKQQ